MDPRLAVPLDQHIEWLKTFGHVHKDTVKHMEKMRDLLLSVHNGDEYAFANVAYFLSTQGLIKED